MKVFISHDSRDKTRFVKDFATKLREKNLDVWYDDWELNFGDSLIDIFDAISQCDVFLSVISENSVESQWVKEESDSAFIRKIEENIKFIPVILPGNFEIPSNMKHMLYCKIENLDNYDDVFNRLVSSIYGISNKPKLGNKPKYTSVYSIDNLEQSDTIVHKLIGDFCLENDESSLSFDELLELTKDFDLSNEDINDSLEILEEKGYVSYIETFDDYVDIRLTYGGCMLYCKYYVEDFVGLLNQIFLSILNNNVWESNQLSLETKIPLFIVDAVFKCLDGNNCITIIETFDGILIDKIFAKGKRYMKKFLDENYEHKIKQLDYLLPDCSKKETMIFKELCGLCLDGTFDDELEPMRIINTLEKYYDEDDFDILQERIAYSLKNLEKNNYIYTVGGLVGLAFSSISISDKGFCVYIHNFYKNPTVYLNIIKELNSDTNFIIDDVSEKYGIPYSITKNLIQIFRKKDFIVCNNDLTDIELTILGKEYFESKIS